MNFYCILFGIFAFYLNIIGQKVKIKINPMPMIEYTTDMSYATWTVKLNANCAIHLANVDKLYRSMIIGLVSQCLIQNMLVFYSLFRLIHYNESKYFWWYGTNFVLMTCISLISKKFDILSRANLEFITVTYIK